ncbi:uncharacterized protein LOC128954488 [Oppia nitens]|uniref:uncharacterized protein LOC128954488 n=1 Tax=Oppia nitens TaxID=1686743 RepID=UPI0023DACC3A|nr:uncharacterized protein LOC128954488 [Oppia nitens]
MDSNIGDLRQKFAKQLLSYFSDININTNRFMRDEISKDNGWISFTTLMTFNRLKQLTGNSYLVFVDTIENLKFDSDFLEIDVINERVRRNPNRPIPPMTGNWLRELNERTVHLAGFPLDVTFDQLTDWLQTYRIVEWLDMRYRCTPKKFPAEKQFKGCIFVTFKTKEMANKLLGQSVIKYGDDDDNNNELLKENKLQYYRRKRDFVAKIKRRKAEERQNRCIVGGGGATEKLAIKLDANNNNNDDTPVYIPHNSSVLMLTDVPIELSYQSIRTYFSKLINTYYQLKDWHIRYVLKINRKRVGYVRFIGKFLARDVLADICEPDGWLDQKVLIIYGYPVLAQVLDGQDERRFWRLNNKHIETLETKITADYRKDMATYAMSSHEICVLKRVDKRLESMKQSLRDSVLIIDKLCYIGRKQKDMVFAYFNKLATVSAIDYRPNSIVYVRFSGSRMARNVLAVYRWVDDDDQNNEPITDYYNRYYKMIININNNNDKREVYARVLTGQAEREYLDESVATIERPQLIKRELKRYRHYR